MPTDHLFLLFDHWSASAGAAAHDRLAALLRASGVAAETLDGETLGARNQRLIALHDEWIGGAIEAQVACSQCRLANSFLVPKAAMRALSPADPDALVRLSYQGGEIAYRVPRMADIMAVGAAADMRLAMLDRCAATGDQGPAAALDAAMLDAIEAGFDRADPLANIVVESLCSGCGAAIAASVNLAAFVVIDLDRLYATLLRDVDMLASAYGWGEAEILALPADRRARYVAMIAQRRAGVAPRLRVQPL